MHMYIIPTGSDGKPFFSLYRIGSNIFTLPRGEVVSIRRALPWGVRPLQSSPQSPAKNSIPSSAVISYVTPPKLGSKFASSTSTRHSDFCTTLTRYS
ncbi:hypothetical protein PGT21_021270 [Puccinia graminis f. sp. tritici]|uniref:Uncharacterized protein n=1 Tax=Puccinia graminis f. sp. tritici TaxID=56615 RepID=A0A5B0LWZ3_PUCGR|nr:hypothetical protein PGTUg99_031151 [Puccinia graminis f. sp. tritici]KAA1104382.1 hypothetical protein PGT21_021270 [Puccinia graminis f. sp. tritici]